MDKKGSTQPGMVMAIVGAGMNNEIGMEGHMPWNIREDLLHFKELTTGHPVIMGRKTWESLPKRPLPGRRNIVVTRNPEYVAEGAETARSLREAVEMSRAESPFIIGGGEIYREALPLCSRVYVTRVFASFPEADTFFPELSPDKWMMTSASQIMTSKSEPTERLASSSGERYRFEVYESRTDK